jgi:hypothetical protein
VLINRGQKISYHIKMCKQNLDTWRRMCQSWVLDFFCHRKWALWILGLNTLASRGHADSFHFWWQEGLHQHHGNHCQEAVYFLIQISRGSTERYGCQMVECSCKSTGIACVWGCLLGIDPDFKSNFFLFLVSLFMLWNSYNLLLPLLTPLLWRCLSMLLLSPMRHSKQLQINCWLHAIVFTRCLLAVGCFRLPIEKTDCESRML